MCLTCSSKMMDNRRVNFRDIKRHFGSVEAARAALGYRSRQTIYNWRTDGVPDGEQCRIQILTGGVLTASRRAIRRAPSAAMRQRTEARAP